MDDVTPQQPAPVPPPAYVAPVEAGKVSNTKFFVLLLSVCVLLAAAGAAAWYFYPKTIVPKKISPAAFLIKTNSDFAQATSLRRSGDYAGALKAYALALPQAKNPAQQVTIQFMMAMTMSQADDQAGAVALLKQIASTTAYSRIMRAHALQYMGVLFYDQARDPAITKEIFTDAPYRSLFDPKSVSVSYRNLFERAAGLYPLADSQFYIARWYIGELARVSTTTLAASTTQSYRDIIQKDLAAGDADIKRLEASPREGIFLPGALLARAVTKGQYSFLGGSSSDAEAAYKDALGIYSSGEHAPGSDWRARYYYAGFLSLAYGSARQQDIAALLRPLYASTTPANVRAVSFLRSALRNNIDSVIPRSLAKTDPEFRQLLLSAGWTAKDIAPKN